MYSITFSLVHQSCCLSILSFKRVFRTLELNEAESRRIFTRYLKRVEFIEFNREKEILSVAQLLLKHGNALEEMVFSWRSKVKYHEKSIKAINEVSKFYKASSYVKLITLVNDK